MSERFWSSSGSSARSTARWVISLPLLLVGSMMFWTMALGSGAVSLLAVSGLAGGPQPFDELVKTGEVGEVGEVGHLGEVAATAAEPMPGQALGTRANPIVVHLQESAEPEDVNDNLGAVAPGESDDDGTGQMSGQTP
jgi:hypothetical protein